MVTEKVVIEDWLTASTYDFLKQPSVAYEKLKTACDNYEEYKAKICGSAIRYDNPLGVKIQQSTSNQFENQMIRLNQLDEERKRAFTLYQSIRLSVCNAICQTPGLTKEQKYVMMERYRGNQPTYKEIAIKYDLKSADAARYIDKVATRTFANNYIALI